EQPNWDNSYTAKIRIRDWRGGADNYGFTLSWEKQRYRDNDYNYEGGRELGLRWSGRVDGQDLIFIRGNQLWVEHRGGQQITGAEYRFYRALPFDRTNIFVRKLHGRGNVRIVEQPARNNNYTAVFMIDDHDGGADRYEIEVIW